MSTTQSYLSFSINEIDNRLKEVMINDNEITTLQTYMNSYAKLSDLSSYAKTTDLSYYATKTDLTSYAKTSDLSSYAKTSDLSYYPTKTDLTSYAKISDLSSYAKTSDLNSYFATISYVNNSIATAYTASEISLDYANSVYTVKQGTKTIGNINIPKDMFVQSGEIVKDPEGVGVGTYIKLTLNAIEADPIYINVQDLVDVYSAAVPTEGSTDDVAITIDGSNTISAHIDTVAAAKVQLYNTINHTYNGLDSEFTNVKSDIAYLNSYVNSYVSTLNSEITTVNGYVGTLQTYVGTLQSYVTTLNADKNTVGSVAYAVNASFNTIGYIFMGPVESYLTTLQTYVGTLQTDMTTVQVDIVTLNADVNTVGSVDYKVHASAYTTSYDLNTTIAALAYRVTYLESLVIK